MSTYDPKLLESWFRFMAEATKAQAQTSDWLEAFGGATSPEAWAEAMRGIAPEGKTDDATDMFAQWQSYWLSLGFVPKSQYDELEANYLELKEKLEAAEREASAAKRLLNVQGQEAQAKEAVDAWSDAVQTTLQAQSAWWSSWLGANEPPTDADHDDDD